MALAGASENQETTGRPSRPTNADERKDAPMNAIELLESQHREVEDLFEEIEETDDLEAKADLFEQLADKLAIHATIEEHHFYPAVKEKRTEDILLESLQEHLAVK